MEKVWFLKVSAISLFVLVTLFFMTNRIPAQNIPGQYQTIAIPPVVGAFAYSGYGSPFGNYQQATYPYGGYQLRYPYGGYQQGYPYGGYQQRYPYGGYQQSYPYGGYQQSYPGYYPSGSPRNYEDADEEVDASDDGDSITLKEGETLSIILSLNATTSYWELDTGELDTDVMSKKSDEFFPATGYWWVLSGATKQWLFESEGTGSTTIKLEYKRYGESGVEDTFEIEVTVE